MRIAYLTHDTPDVFYRVDQYLPYLHANGVTTSIFRTPKNPFSRIGTFMRLRRYDAVVVQRKLFNMFWLGLLKSCARRLILDMDDAIMFSSDALNPHSQTRRKRFAAMVQACDAVIAGNGFLKQTTLEICPNATVYVIPTVADVHSRPMKNHETRNEIAIGWLGSSSTIKYLELVKPVLKAISETFPRVRIKIVSNEFPYWDFIDKKTWKREDETSDLIAMDIGIMPLEDTLWTRGKCGFKLIQYMSAGLPVVASAVGANCEIVSDKETGFLCHNSVEWSESLSNLIEDHLLRSRMGKFGRLRAEGLYSVKSQAPSYLNVLSEVCSK
jgi:glycosyltransferase involved in cell wall biosynthesis